MGSVPGPNNPRCPTVRQRRSTHTTEDTPKAVNGHNESRLLKLMRTVTSQLLAVKVRHRSWLPEKVVERRGDHRAQYEHNQRRCTGGSDV